MSCFYHATAPPAIYTLSLHDALPISVDERRGERPTGGTAGVQDAAAAVAGLQPKRGLGRAPVERHPTDQPALGLDRKSTRLNSSHVAISYAVFCLKKKRYYNCGTCNE